ncbi:hypothetical protein GIB67_032228 [Kingdonia uniflora]|uniref:DUF8040 domain-containing protein n=1 Tax=Kingdonia uniflora TaxID=39325 RepID=A0A7J7MXA8_9MAGN|nr:hypothetical protein GIB67_032228 [Kingdonia uniflora]
MNDHIKRILSSKKRCRWNLRMGRELFHRLCALIKDCDLVRATRNCSVEEQFMRFLHILGHNVHHRVLEGRYYRSLETISLQFNEVLDAIVKLYKVLIVDHGETIHNGKVQTQVTDDLRFFPYFKDCLGALDGTHIIASVPEDETIKFRSGRSNKITQNILEACSFDLRFTYILAGWEGTHPR